MSDGPKVCPVCAETIKAAAIKCRFCNTDLAVYAVAREADQERQLFTGHPMAIYTLGQWVAVLFTLGLAYLIYWRKSRATTYQITTQRIRVERGLFSKSKDNIELFHIDHLDLHKPLGMRLVGPCMVYLRSSDPNVPTVTLHGIPNLETLATSFATAPCRSGPGAKVPRSCRREERRRPYHRHIFTFLVPIRQDGRLQEVM
ncbi:MAG: hypothetical protein FJ245_04085 [Nitrospira sp.]|nr:hypothetical protein [Nitrospira sp.]